MLLSLFLSSCSLFDPDNTDLLSNGIIEIAEDAELTSSSNSRLVIDGPQYDHFSVDACFSISGRVLATAGPQKYFWLKISRGDENSSYWLSGDFDKEIWLRFGKGEYDVSIYSITNITVNDQGVISSWSYLRTPVWSVTADNLRDEDGRLLYPSAIIQSDNVDIRSRAELFSSTDTAGIILEVHDWVVKYLYYDFDSLEPALRKKQDAFSVLSNKTAVCEGYTTLYTALLRARGIPAQYVSGTAGDDNGRHAWSRVSDSFTWKFVDTTWDDPVMNDTSDYPNGENLRHDYFWKDSFDDHILEDQATDRSIGTLYPSVIFPGYPEGSY